MGLVYYSMLCRYSDLDLCEVRKIIGEGGGIDYVQFLVVKTDRVGYLCRLGAFRSFTGNVEVEQVTRLTETAVGEVA